MSNQTAINNMISVICFKTSSLGKLEARAMPMCDYNVVKEEEGVGPPIVYATANLTYPK